MFPRSVGTLSTRSKIGRDEIKWQELVQHFRLIQAKHEKARRQALGTDSTAYPDFSEADKAVDRPGAATIGPGGDKAGRPVTVGRTPLRRRVTGEIPLNPMAVPGRSGALSPLNPRARGAPAAPNGSVNGGLTSQAQKQRNILSRK